MCTLSVPVGGEWNRNARELSQRDIFALSRRYFSLSKLRQRVRRLKMLGG